MSPHNSNNTESPSSADAPSSEVFDIEALSPRQQRVVLVCDVVESVRWMEHDEDNAITRWSQFATAVRSRIAPAHGGEVIKSTGDGLMMEFQAAPGAVAAANAMQKIATEGNQGYASERQMHLRIGIHQTQARRDAHDLYGHGVNLAARITTLAGPGEIIVTPEVRDHLTDSLDGEIEDMGECYLKHLSEPQRVYRVGDAGHKPLLNRIEDYGQDLKATLVVIPFESRSGLPDQKVLGDLIADGVIARLVRSNTLRVLSRFSTVSLRGEHLASTDLKALLGADYVLRGDFAAFGEKLTLGYELSSTRDGCVLEAKRTNTKIADLFEAQSEACGQIASEAINCIVNEQLKSSLTKPLPTIASYSLYLIGIAGIHRSMPRENEAGEAALRHIMERHPRAAEPAIWLAQWMAIQSSRSLLHDRQKVQKIARDLVDKSLDAEPHNSFGLAISGLLDAFFASNFSLAEASYEQSLALNPNECLAWLYKATLLSWTDQGQMGAEAAEKALNLSPLHPLRYYIECLAALPFLSSGNFDRAIELCRSSIRVNRTHNSSYRILAAALQLSNRSEEANKCIKELLIIEPQSTAEKFLQRYPGRDSKFARVFQNALLDSGLPK